MKIIVTGLSGFLGRSIIRENLNFKHEVFGIGRSKSNNVVCNLDSEIPLIPNDTDIIIHAAGKAHTVPKTDLQIQEFHVTNYIGTKNLIKGINNSKIKLKQFFYISTVAVYGLDSGVFIDETTPNLGNSPYAISKIKAEKLLISWSKKTETPLLILRVPLLIGKSPKGNFLKLLNSIKAGTHVAIKNLEAKKSMLLVDDLSKFLLSNINTNGIYNLVGPRDYYISEIENALKEKYSRKSLIYIPVWFLKPFAIIGDKFTKFPINSEVLIKLTSTLTFSDFRARKEINWLSNDVIEYIKKSL